MRPSIRHAVPVILVLLALCGAQLTERQTARGYHTAGELNFFRSGSIDLPFADNGFFYTSGHCDGCHGIDPLGIANVDQEGNDLSPVENWRASMMANSARDPFWRAKVSHEVTVNPAHKSALENKCASCHAPMGKFAYDHYGAGPYSMEILATDEVGKDGVSCLACHKIGDEGIGNAHSGNLNYTPLAVAYGPFEKPFEAPMQEFVGIIPVYSPHINHAGICAGCHTLLTESVDLDGAYTGQTFVEQATYHEWLNSEFADDGANPVTCQGCHIPRIEHPVLLSANHNFLPARSPYGKHDMVGGNSFMLKLMKNHRQVLGIPADDLHFDTVIVRTERMLQQQTLDLELALATTTSDTAFFEVLLRNKAGHKFPSGYPSRRAFIEFVVLKDDGDTLFSSGVLRPDYEVQGLDSDFEPHYHIVRASHQVQIYEMVMGDVQGNVTTVLERAFETLKDNRLVPRGFSTSHAAYDTTRIYGNALTDPDFNFDGFEGSGTDRVRYHVALNGHSGTVKASARVYYQPVPPKWMEEMFALSTPEIDLFRPMYEDADHTPVLVAADSLVDVQLVTSIRITDLSRSFTVSPNPTTDGRVRIGPMEELPIRVDVLSANGKVMSSQSGSHIIELPTTSGIYYLRAMFSDGRGSVRKVMRL